MKTQPLETKPRQVLLRSEGLKDQRNQWDSFLRLWERANLIRSFLWSQEIADEKILLTQFLARLRRFFSVDFCFAAFLFDGAKILEAGLPEAKMNQLPVNFVRLCLDLITNSRVPIVWKQPHKPFDFCSTVISPLSPSVGQPLGFVMMGHSMPKNFASSELFLLQFLAGELSWAIRDRRSRKNQRKLLATVSHQLKNPLQVIVGYSALVQDDLALTCSRQQREQFQQIERSARQLLDIVNGLIDAAVTHGENPSVVAEPVDLIATLQEIFAFYGKAAEEKGLKFQAKSAADLPAMIVTDPVKFRQIVRNLIDSAMLSIEGGEVEVLVKRDKGMLEIVAKEKGDGMTATFDQLHSEVRNGIGMRVVKEFSDLLKGHVHVHRRPGEGSEFTVCLPCE